MDPRWLVVALTNGLLAFLMGQLNHGLSAWGVSLFLVGLMLPLAALRFRLRTGVTAMLFSGFLLDAARPTLFGANSLLLVALFVAWHLWRARLPRDGAGSVMLGALATNLVLFLLQPLLAGAAQVVEAQDPNVHHWQPLFFQLKPLVVEVVRTADRLVGDAATGGRIAWDLAISELAVVLLAPWYFALQEKALLLCGVNLAEEIRQPGGAL